MLYCRLMNPSRPKRNKERVDYKQLIDCSVPKPQPSKKARVRPYFPVEISNRRFDPNIRCEVVDLHYVGYSAIHDEIGRPFLEIVELKNDGEFCAACGCKSWKAIDRSRINRIGFIDCLADPSTVLNRTQSEGWGEGTCVKSKRHTYTKKKQNSNKIPLPAKSKDR